MRRRAYLLWIGSALVVPVLPSATSAQQRVHRLAFVHSGIPADKLTESAGPFWVRRVYQTLRELGDVEGQNLIVERFSAVTCPCRKLDPDVMMVQSAEDRQRKNAADRLDRPRQR